MIETKSFNIKLITFLKADHLIMSIISKTLNFKVLSLLFGLILMTSCSYLPKGEYEEPENPLYKDGSLLGEGGLNLTEFLNPKDESTGGLPINALLWRASLNTISVVPLSSVDAFGGTIISEWYIHPDDKTKRIKVAIFITDQELRADAVKVEVYVQERGNNGQEWQDSGRDAKFATRLEDLILTRAREIRAASVLESN